MMAQQFVDVRINGKMMNAMVDTGSNRTIIATIVGGKTDGRRTVLSGVDGRRVMTQGETIIRLSLPGFDENVRCLVLDRLVGGAKVILGIDIILRLGGLRISRNGVSFGVDDRSDMAAAVISETEDVQKNHDHEILIEDADFTAFFNGENWTVRWKWKDGNEPMLPTDVRNCRIPERLEEDFATEIEDWISNGWLVEEAGKVGMQNVPLLAIEQRNKKKVRPVMDFRVLNGFVESHTGNSHDCSGTLRQWR